MESPFTCLILVTDGKRCYNAPEEVDHSSNNFHQNEWVVKSKYERNCRTYCCTRKLGGYGRHYNGYYYYSPYYYYDYYSDCNTQLKYYSTVEQKKL